MFDVISQNHSASSKPYDVGTCPRIPEATQEMKPMLLLKPQLVPTKAQNFVGGCAPEPPAFFDLFEVSVRGFPSTHGSRHVALTGAGLGRFDATSQSHSVVSKPYDVGTCLRIPEIPRG